MSEVLAKEKWARHYNYSKDDCAETNEGVPARKRAWLWSYQSYYIEVNECPSN